MKRLSRGWALTRASVAFVWAHPSFLVFPALSTALAFVATFIIVTPAAVSTGALSDLFSDDSSTKTNPIFYIACVAALFVCTFVSVFFNVALAACTSAALRGERTSIRAGFAVARLRVGRILGWTIVSVTIGLVVRSVAERFGALGKLGGWVADTAWAVATFFIVPVITMEDTGPFDSIRRSTAIVKQRWGEGATGTVAISAVTVALVLAASAVSYIGFVWFYATGQIWIARGVLGLWILAVILICVVFSALTNIFRVAVYQYAITGESPNSFDESLIRSAITSK